MELKNSIKGGIIAAGLGSRFLDSGMGVPKPMIKVKNLHLIDWTLSQFVDAEIDDVTIIFNTNDADDIQKYIKEKFPHLKFKIICKDTNSSYESFINVLAVHEKEKILITTVDSIYKRKKLKELIAFSQNLPKEAIVLGITKFIDDEKPLYVEINNENKIISLGQKKSEYVTSGIYLLNASVQCMGLNKEFPSLRYFLSFLASQKLSIYGFDIGQSVDIDRPQDVQIAEDFLTKNS